MTEKMNPIGQIPSPYGTMVNVYFDRSRHTNEDDCYFFDLNGTMDMGGIYGEENRARCVKAVNAGVKESTVSMEIFAQFGARPVPKEPLPRPAESVYNRVELPKEAMNVIENWVDLILDQKTWRDRADAILTEALPKGLDLAESWDLPPEIRDNVIALSTSHMLTSGLEHLPDVEIDCLEAAAMFSLTLHEEWRDAGIKWLLPIRKTWFRDWMKARPTYRRFAKVMKIGDPHQPKWLHSLI